MTNSVDQVAASDAAALVDRRDHILIITINRPHARNAVNSSVSVVLTGTGDKSFCTGADLQALAHGENLYHPVHPEWGFAGYARHFVDCGASSN